MPEPGDRRPKDVDLMQQFSELLRVLPPSGIAYRGDMAKRIPEIQRNGLIKRGSSYIVLVPPHESNINSQRRPEELLRELQEGIDFALTYADIEGSPGIPIKDPQFVDYVSYYTEHPDQLYSLSWFTSPTPEQFPKVAKKGTTFDGRTSGFTFSSVDRFGKIPASHTHTPIIADLSDIKTAQDAVLHRFHTGKAKIGVNASFRLTNGREYLRDLGRRDFHREISKIMTTKLIQTATAVLKTS